MVTTRSQSKSTNGTRSLPVREVKKRRRSSSASKKSVVEKKSKNCNLVLNLDSKSKKSRKVNSKGHPEIKKRSFTIVEIRRSDGTKVRFDGGRYISVQPKSAGKKAVSSALKHKKVALDSGATEKFTVVIKETTRTSKHQTFTEIVKVKRLSESNVKEVCNADGSKSFKSKHKYF